MKYKVIIPGLIAAAILASAVGCSRSNTPTPTDPSLPDGYEPSTTPITFKTQDNWGDGANAQTKGIATTRINFVEFGVLGYWIKNGTSIENTPPNFMYKQLVNRDNYESTEWNYSPIKYWPNSDGDKLQFFGYFPRNNSDIEVVSTDEVGYPKFVVTPNVGPHYQRDFITASTDELEGGNVSFNFTHKLAQARIYVAQCGQEGADLLVESIKVTGFRKSGTLVYDPERTEDDKFVWQHQKDNNEAFPTAEEQATYEFGEEELFEDMEIPYLPEAVENIGSYGRLDNGDGKSYMMLIPQDKVAALHFKLQFTYEVAGSKAKSAQEFFLPADKITLDEGKIKIFLLLVDPTGVGFGSIRVTSALWDDKEIDNDDEGNTDGFFEIE